MKKSLRMLFALMLALVLTAGAAVPAFALTAYEDLRFPPTSGIESMDTVVDTKGITLGDHFWTGSLGSPESSGWLDWKPDSPEMTWTLKDGVLILKGSAASADLSGVMGYSPFWHNPYIETIVIDSRVRTITYLFRNDLPNLKTVIVLGPTFFRMDGEYTSTNRVPGDFPEDHDINFVFENCYKNTDIYSYAMLRHGWNPEGHGPAISTNISFDKWSESTTMYGRKTTYTSGETGWARAFQDHYSTLVPGDDRAGYLADAAPILANARMNKAAIDMLPEDLVAAVNAFGGFRNSADTPPIVPIPQTPDAANVSPWAKEGISKAFSLYIGRHGFLIDNPYSPLDWKGKDLTANITRGQFASLVIDAYLAITGEGRNSIPSSNDVNGKRFSDDGYMNPHSGDMYRASRLSIMNGYGNSNEQPVSFGVNDPLTREQAATILDRLATACGKALPDGANPFTDGVSDWAADSVGRVYAAGIMNGVGGTSFNPHGNYTAEQALVTLVRLTDYTGVKVTPYTVEGIVRAAQEKVAAAEAAEAAAQAAARAAKAAKAEADRNHLLELFPVALEWFNEHTHGVSCIYAYYYDVDDNVVRLCAYMDGRVETTVIGGDMPEMNKDRWYGAMEPYGSEDLFEYWVDDDGNHIIMP